MGIFDFLDYCQSSQRVFLILLILTNIPDRIYFSRCLWTNLELSKLKTHTVINQCLSFISFRNIPFETQMINNHQKNIWYISWTQTDSICLLPFLCLYQWCSHKWHTNVESLLIWGTHNMSILNHQEEDPIQIIIWTHLILLGLHKDVVCGFTSSYPVGPKHSHNWYAAAQLPR